MESIKQVAITGGTHGNELTGIYLIKHWLANTNDVERSSFETELHLTNPEAYNAVRRYLDQDLNRQFSLQDLNNAALQGYEQQRAKALDALLGPKESPRIDFVIDMHTTTANMGMSLIFNSSHPLVIGMAFYIKQQMPQATLFFHPRERLEDNFLTSLGRCNGLLIEVGPVAQGLLHYPVYAETRSAVMHALDYLQRYNTRQPMNLPSTLTGYQFTQKIPLPTNAAGDITAMVHPNLAGKDYQAIQPGDPLFITLGGDTMVYQGEETVYGAFINEAAYYDQQIGLSFMKKIDIRRPDGADDHGG